MPTWDNVTNQRIALLHPAVRQVATDFINAVESKLRIRLRITQSLRSIPEQDALYAQGRTTAGKIVTNAKGGDSYHNYGLAWDVVEIENGLANWETNWLGISEIAEEMGIEWGGNFKSIKDKPHFQMSFGLSIAQLKAKLKKNQTYIDL